MRSTTKPRPAAKESLPSVELESTTATMDGSGTAPRRAAAAWRQRSPPLRTGMMMRAWHKAAELWTDMDCMIPMLLPTIP